MNNKKKDIIEKAERIQQNIIKEQEKVYVLVQYDWEDSDILGVFRNEKDAEDLKALMEEQQKDKSDLLKYLYYVEEYILQ